MQETIDLEINIESSRQGTYFLLPFRVPDNIERLTVSYQYPRRPESDLAIEGGIFTSTPEVNIVDFGLINPGGHQVGASGADKSQITISDTDATPGYQPVPIIPGEWQIIVGAYKIAPDGVTVLYKIFMDSKFRRLLKGDLHTHSLASDGVHSIEELTVKAARNDLDFLAITDHNQQAAKNTLPKVKDFTLIPGVEWTHFQGHANFLGVDTPYDGAFFTNTEEEVLSRFTTAHERGALITINHPFEEIARFQFNMNSLPYDCIEVWNGPMREANLRAVGLWQKLLVSGKNIPISAGSDYHRDTPFIFLGGPTLCVYALSNSVTDILAAVKCGHAYAAFAPNGPSLVMTAGDGIMGDSVPWKEVKEMDLTIDGLMAGDIVRLVTAVKSENLFEANTDGRVKITAPITEPGFGRVEILRTFLPGLPMLHALLSNPIYFEI